MVQLPGASTGEVIAKPVNLLIVHRILQSLLRGHLRTRDDLNDLVDQQPHEVGDAQTGH
jgi:hypothetical protein